MKKTMEELPDLYQSDAGRGGGGSMTTAELYIASLFGTDVLDIVAKRAARADRWYAERDSTPPRPVRRGRGHMTIDDALDYIDHLKKGRD